MGKVTITLAQKIDFFVVFLKRKFKKILKLKFAPNTAYFRAKEFNL